jgi:1,4-dihydroxy-2-naphthoyl-CoA hydrolase
MGVTNSVPTFLTGGFDDVLGVNYVASTPDSTTAEVTITDSLLQPHGIVHGGVYCAIVESVASVSAAQWLESTGAGSNVVGVNNSTDFLRAIKAGVVTAVSTPIHRGRRQQLWLVEITDGNGKLVARGQVRLQNLPADAPPA